MMLVSCRNSETPISTGITKHFCSDLPADISVSLLSCAETVIRTPWILTAQVSKTVYVEFDPRTYMVELFINLLDAIFTSFKGAVRGIWEHRHGNASRSLWIWTVGGFLIGIGILVFFAVVLIS